MKHAKDLAFYAHNAYAMATGGSDIGIAHLEGGRKVFTSWGRNLKTREASYIERNTKYEAVCIGKTIDRDIFEPRNNFEIIIPEEEVNMLLQSKAPVLDK